MIISEEINGQTGTLLHWAAYQGNLACVQWLIENGANIDTLNDQGRSALNISGLGPIAWDLSVASKKDVIDLIVLNKSINLEDKEALESVDVDPVDVEDQLAVIEFLIKNGADINFKNQKGETWLHWAIQQSHVEIAKALIFRGASVKEETTEGKTPLVYAIRSGEVELAALLMKYGADMTQADENGLTALHLAAKEGHFPTVDYMLKNGADINVATNEGATPLHYATELVVPFSNAGEGMAVRAGKIKIAELLIEKGADVNVQTVEGYTPISNTAFYAERDLTKKLIEKGAKIEADMKTRGGMTLFQTALWMRDLELAQAMLDRGADINTLTYDGESLLEWAVNQEQRAATEWLINNGANIDIRSRDDEILLHWAAKHNYTRIAKALIERGVAINDKNENGFTPRDSVTAVAMDQLLDEYEAKSSMTLEERRYFKAVNELGAKLGAKEEIESVDIVE